MNEDLISIVVPIYNVEKYLRKCLDSIIAQTYTNYQVILVDDGSTDGSANICDEYVRKDVRFVCIHKKNGGLSDARNVGIENATGELITLIDSDDYISKKYLENLYKNLVESNADISIGNYIKVYDNQQTIQEDSNNHTLEVFGTEKALLKLYDNEKKYQFTMAVNKLYKTYILKKVPFPVGRKFEDSATAHAILNNCNKIVYTNQILYYYFTREGSITKSKIRDDDAILAIEDRIKYFEYNCMKNKILQMTFEYYLTILMGTYIRLDGCKKSKEIKNDILKKVKYTVFNQRKIISTKIKLRSILFIMSPYVYKKCVIICNGENI